MAKFLRLTALIRHILYYHYHWKGAITKLVQLKEADACAKVDSPSALGNAGQGLGQLQAGGCQPEQVIFSKELFKCYYFVLLPKAKEVGKPADNRKN